MNKRVHVYIHGDVTGVNFRYWTAQNAKRLGLTGWVRNADRGLVEAVFEGEEEVVKKMLEKCHKGPEIAWVKKVDIDWQETKGEYLDFEIRY